MSESSSLGSQWPTSLATAVTESDVKQQQQTTTTTTPAATESSAAASTETANDSAASADAAAPTAKPDSSAPAAAAAASGPTAITGGTAGSRPARPVSRLLNSNLGRRPTTKSGPNQSALDREMAERKQKVLDALQTERESHVLHSDLVRDHKPVVIDGQLKYVEKSDTEKLVARLQSSVRTEAATALVDSNGRRIKSDDPAAADSSENGAAAAAATEQTQTQTQQPATKLSIVDAKLV